MKKLHWGILGIFLGMGANVLAELPAGRFYTDGPKKSQAIALTFDDGPGPYTQAVLDLLKKYGVRATFFMNGDQVALRPKIALMVKEAGHEIGDHTWSHINFYAYSKKHSLEETQNKIKSEIQKSVAEIKKATGLQAVSILRMPNGFYRPWMKEIAHAQGLALINWTFGEDWHNVSAEKMQSNYVAQVRPGAILLFHDGGLRREKTLASAEAVIQAALKKGYKLQTVSELLSEGMH